MSLLMNALKKAEKAKQAGQSEEEVPAISDANRNLAQELGLDPPVNRSSSASTAGDVAGKADQAFVALKPMELALEPEPAAVAAPAKDPEVRTPSRPSTRSASSNEAGRGSARAVFSAKGAAKTSSRMPFYSVVGVSLLATVGYGAYLWMQMSAPARPIAVAATPGLNRPPATAAPAPNPVTELPVPLPIGNGAPESARAPIAGVSPGSELDTPPPGRQIDTSLPRGEVQPDRIGARAPLPQRESRGPRDAARASGGAPIDSPANLRISRDANIATVNADVLAGYSALQAGDLDRAGQSYDRALRSEPANRDALLGAATVLLRLERTDAAEAYFRQLLRLHPNDAYATAQLAALTSRGDPVGSLSQVNSLIARESDHPESASAGGALAFVQGNQLAAQSRWPEAQQAYFNAHRADPANADYCYNLAISLDRIREPRLARDYYRKAIELSRGRPAGFDATRAQARLDQIDGALK